jgi:two-component system KDP operon response regulator KdpE
MDGFDVLKDIRLFSAVPVIILTARDQESDIVKGLEKGADDYLVKPFRQLELMSRAQAELRRYHLVSSYSPLSAGSLKFGQSMHTLFLGDKRINLTSTEGIILSHLMRNPK